MARTKGWRKSQKGRIELDILPYLLSKTKKAKEKKKTGASDGEEAVRETYLG